LVFIYYRSSNKGAPVHIILAERETEIMEVLWKQGPSTVAEVREQLPDQLAYTTVLTILRNLEGKGYVGHDEEGRAHRYSALVAQDAARRSALKDLASKFFDGSAELLMTHLVSDQKLTGEQVRRMRRLLNQRAKRDKP
jgi:predicted transcriptional regulator